MAEDNRYRTHEIRVKLSVEEYAIIQQKAFEAEMSISDAVRSLIMFGTINAKWLDKDSMEVMTKANEIMDRCVDSINRIGVNLNQIAYCTNTVGDADKQTVEEALQHTREIEDLLLGCYEEVRALCNANSTYT